MNDKIHINEAKRLQVSQEELDQAMETANQLVEEEGFTVNFFCGGGA